MSPSYRSPNAVWETLNPSTPRAKVGANTSSRFPVAHPKPGHHHVVPIPMQIDVVISGYFAPSAKRPRPARQSYRKKGRRKVAFYGTVDVRESLLDPPPQHRVWYSKDEIQAMRSSAMKRNTPLRHSDRLDRESTLRLQQHLLVSPLEDEDDAARVPAAAMLPRVQSAQCELSSSCSTHPANPRDIRYQQLVSEMDREVYITNDERRDSTRRRLNHCYKVLGEYDRQIDEGYTAINSKELSWVSKNASGDAHTRALIKARKDRSLAQAILMSTRR